MPFCLVPAGIWDGEWIALAAAPVTADDVGAWPNSVGILVKWVAFLSSFHWPVGGADLGVGGVSFVEMLILYELRAGERLVLERPSPGIGGLDAQFQCRLFRLVQALIFGVPAGSLGPFQGTLLPGGSGRFMPCGTGANYRVHRHIGWEKCGHGLTSRPRESASEGFFLNELLLLSCCYAWFRWWW